MASCWCGTRPRPCAAPSSPEPGGENHGFADPVATFAGGREAYVERSALGAVVPYAILKEGRWHAKGEMRSFGMSEDATSDEDWAKQAWELLSSLPGDTLVTVVDCHI